MGAGLTLRLIPFISGAFAFTMPHICRIMRVMFTTNIVLLIFGLGIVFFYWIFNFIVFYHLTRFGIGVRPKRYAATFLFGSVILFCVSVLFFLNMAVSNPQDQTAVILKNIFPYLSR